MEETRVLKKIIRLLQMKFYYVVVVIEKSQNMDVLSIQDLMGKLQAHEKIVNEIQKDVGVQALFSKQYGSRYSQGGRGHGQSKEREARGRFGREG